MDIGAIRERLKEACKEAGSQSEWARKNGVSVQLVSLTLSGERESGPSLLRAMGLKKVEAITVDYIPINVNEEQR